MKGYNKIGITLKKLKDNNSINWLHHEKWIDYNKETKLFLYFIVGEDDLLRWVLCLIWKNCLKLRFVIIVIIIIF